MKLILFVRVLIFILALLLAPRAFAQVGAGTRVLTISGRVTDIGTGEPIEAVSVINTTTQKAVYTDRQGRYTINAEDGQSLAATYLGYKTKLVSISNGSEHIPINFVLQREQFKMEEFVVKPRYTPYQADSAARYGTYKRTLIRGHEGSLGSPVTWLAERISGRSKQRFRFQKTFAALENERYLETVYSPQLVNQMTYLTGDTLAHFMNSYPMPVDYARAATELEIKMWIRTNYRDWKAKGMPMPHIVTDTITNRK